jgi:3-methyl-2-oxobutanoate hydroxymethyltransferase
MVNAPDPNWARACEMAGVDTIVVGRRQPVEATLHVLPEIRRAASETLITAVMPLGPGLVSDEEAIGCAVKLMDGGADMIYCTGMRPDRIAKLAYQRIPCVAHLGLVPYFVTWFGGFRAVGKTADEAEGLYRTAMELDEAGIVASELECIPHQVASVISSSVKFITYSMGSGAGCDGQYLFACDLLGSHTGHYPRHSIRYENFFEKSVDVFKRFVDDVNTGTYPAQKNIINMPSEEYKGFLERIQH